MSITRINEFLAAPERTRDLRDFLMTLLPYLEGCEGCEGVVLLSAEDDENKFVILERWTNREAHAAALAAYPPEKMTAAQDLLGGPPRGEFFTTL